jgi:integrase
MTRQELTAARSAAVVHTVCKATAAHYHDIVRHLSDNNLPFDFDGLCDLLVMRRPPFAYKTVQVFISALNKINRSKMTKTNGIRPLSDDERTTALEVAEGCLNDFDKTKSERGSIDEKKLYQLIKLMREDGASWELMFAVRLCFATASRCDRVDKLSLMDFKMDVTGRWYLEVPRDHDPTVRNTGITRMERRSIHQLIQVDLNDLILSLRDKQLPDVPILGGYWNVNAVRDYIKQAATKYKWDRQLEWVIHSLRHGAATTAKDDGREVADTSGHLSAAMAAHYARRNAERVAGLQRAAQRAKEKSATGSQLMAAMQAAQLSVANGAIRGAIHASAGSGANGGSMTGAQLLDAMRSVTANGAVRRQRPEQDAE